ncbi:MAG TPA: type II toxin-antitoxin system VapC family toxin [Candidatus Competibacteraceae bacterium]|nr:type II toxin-antitoxin system VapC family toxin [Candidatus Competibacteraceae bacterium]
MIILDTNIVSEMMKTAPSRTVLDWLNAQDAASLYVTTITLAEIGYGLRLLPDGQRRRLLAERFDQFIARAFDQRILSFDEAAARAYGDIMGHRKELGRPISVTDGQIAAIARANGFGIATRNIKDFEDSQIALINPFR